ncbi:MAG TPA: substrate-binding and VWA domain-containing protein [Micromonosporaceae bacterium]|nr:substrate-binding and VWA domain-containing protein [Micromonosporaceae bacterium]
MVYEPSPRRRNPLPLIIASVVGVMAIVGTYLVLRPGGDDGGDADQAADRAGCVSLSVAASSEKAALLSEIATAYNKAERSFDGKCANVKVFAKASGGAMEALAAGWDEGREGNPAPQVWSPASSSWVSLLRQRVSATDRGTLVPEGTIASIAQTPLVLAMPKPMAEALGWPGKPIGWSDVLGLTNDPRGWGAAGHPEWGAFRLGKTNPHFSTSGLNATVGAYFAATGRSSDLTEADLADPKVLQFVKGVESGVVHYGDTTLTFLSNLADADARGQGMAYISAVTVEEKSVYDYNQGNPTGDPKLVGKGTKPRVPLVAVYPKEGTLLSDNPFVVLTTASDEQKAAAADLLTFLHAPAQQKRFTDAAFRSFEGKPGSVLSPTNGLLPEQEFALIDPPAAAVMAKALSTWDEQRKRARVLLVLDVSGSMNEQVGNGKSKLELAKAAAAQSLDLFAADDEVGLWTFSTERAGASKPYTERVPIGGVAVTRDQMRAAITSLAPDGGTALYATARAAQQHLLASADPDRINAVVLLTDGKNEYPKDNDLNSLIRDLDASSLENSVRVFTVAYGDKADLGVLDRISKSSRAAAYDARDPATIDKVLINVLSNF